MLKRISSSQTEEIQSRIMNRERGDSPDQLATVKKIIEDVRVKGDEALFEYTYKFDGYELNKDNICVSDREIEEAYKKISCELLDIVRESAKNISKFHELQKRESFTFEGNGITLGQRITPIEKAGVYVPGGKANYPSSVLMNIIPAKVAGVNNIIMVTPPGKDGEIAPLTLAAAKEAGADMIFKVGGAQAIAALAYGTKTIPAVNKITGPGNIYVALAKKEVFGKVGIDMIAGPSEVLIIADNGANPKFLAADFLSQAEHDEMAACIFITDSKELAGKVEAEIERQAKLLPKKDIVYKSLENYGTIIIAKDLEDAARVSNLIAPEHLELCVRDPGSLFEKIKNAGSIFMGDYSPEPLGDYFAGPNHVLPTNGTAAFSSPLSVDDFIKKSGVICYNETAFKKAYKKIEKFAKAEGLFAHAKSAAIRFEEI